ncbi:MULTISPECIES: hypothetical protein [Pseudoalteromonas]|uniref:Uncharacterized protein n=1 Tax=Pseudoalteromonas amylolytica TaxID=1859457 RepID=A0A1S1MTT8_9GAMM|nr:MULTISPECIES: hypothetical protein [Pseudoalteromonas]OHU85149.1 hypothetical protein BFC16_20985 [Pseudoalteromonas sp. JW3]OHU89900.1 hypothetical protein BET10_13990 [Pseudoalteromonas amylolytica]
MNDVIKTDLDKTDLETTEVVFSDTFAEQKEPDLLWVKDHKYYDAELTLEENFEHLYGHVKISPEDREAFNHAFENNQLVEFLNSKQNLALFAEDEPVDYVSGRAVITVSAALLLLKGPMTKLAKKGAFGLQKLSALS